MGKQESELARDEHRLYLSVDRWNWSPQNQQRSGIVPQIAVRLQIEKRRRVGGPFAASTGGMSDVRSGTTPSYRRSLGMKR
jgi:hypothetical protein